MKKKVFYSKPECWDIPVEQCDAICQSFQTEELVLEEGTYEW